MGRIADLRVKAQRRTGNVYDTWFTRRLSIYITAILYPLGVSANAVSAFSGLVAITACALIGLGTGWQVYLGIATVHLYAILDSVDGELARLRQTFTLRGLFLEDLCAYTMINGMFLALGSYLARTMGEGWPLVLGVVVVAFGRNAMPVARRAWLASIETRRPLRVPVGPPSVPSGQQSRIRALRQFVEHVLLHFTNMWVITTTLVLIEELAGLHRLHLVLASYCFFVAVVLLKEIAILAAFGLSGALDRKLVEIYDHVRAVPPETGEPR